MKLKKKTLIEKKPKTKKEQSTITMNSVVWRGVQ
jgi:hypothetical protein